MVAPALLLRGRSRESHLRRERPLNAKAELLGQEEFPFDGLVGFSILIVQAGHLGVPGVTFPRPRDDIDTCRPQVAGARDGHVVSLAFASPCCFLD